MDGIWVAKVPEGEVRTEVDPPTLEVQLYSWVFATTFIAGFSVVLRIFTRLYIVRTALNIDDYLVITSLMFTISLIVVLFNIVAHGLAHHMWDIRFATYNINFPILTIVGTILYALAITFSKLSILFLYLRLSPQVWFRRGVYCLIAIVCGYSIVYILLNILACVPVRATWDLTITDKTCIDQLSIYLALSIANIIMDFLILLLPIPVVMPLQMARRQKASIILLFGTGAFVVGVAIRRTIPFPQLLSSPDYSWDAADVFVWCFIEINAGMICASVPALKPFFVRYLPSFITSQMSSKHGASSSAKNCKNRLNTVVAQNIERRRMQDESYELASTDGKKDGIEDDEAKLWSGYQKNVKSALGCHARDSSRQVDGENSNSSVDTLGDIGGPQRGDRTIVVSADGIGEGGSSSRYNGIMVHRETTVQHAHGERD
ncbi:integral membrane protein [Colletotrichum karsti]|uniref:Integral membrane protein n=1 Tax=Colletotrichum karsti TaxID=1095194 RepID=A0A9P6IGA1_9PEZI|nr:uncharacterized protein CkaCkLH20_01035 [Colletotrichum karsti]KAF9881889.1 integral membrane protein [Colletotrichum karsti]